MSLIQSALTASIPTSQQSGFIVWNPYYGETALLLALILFLVGSAVVLLGSRLKKSRQLPRPRTWLKAVIAVVWVLQILILLRIFKHIIDVDPSAGVTGPVLPITLASAACTFAYVAYLLRRDGGSSALGGAFAVAVVGPMVFELPFVLIVGPVGETPTDPGAALTIPFFIAMFTTLAFLTFSSRAAITRYSLYFLGAMFLAFAVWALFGFSYPSSGSPFLLNAVSKVLGFATTASMFTKEGPTSAGKQEDPQGLPPS
ncbi:MAG: hypothetical protein OK456_05930 [Thaumarchaeota archaeon]|nr:hypothetical protein [Nitrososphaerota archaeon]